MQVGPFRRLAVAVSLSPRREALLAEAGHLAEMLGAQLLVIHVGKPSEHMQCHMEALMERQHLDGPGCRLIFPSGPPDRAIAEVCAQEQVDLLILGALPSRTFKERIYGTIAQRTLRRVPCSVLLLANPKKSPKPVREIAVGTLGSHDSPLLLEHALRLASCLHVKDVHILKRDGKSDDPADMHLPRMAQRRRLVGTELEEARAWLEPFEEEEALESTQPDVHIKLYAGNHGHAWVDFARRHAVDMLVMEAPSVQGMGPLWRLSLPHLSYAVAELPTNLLMLR